MLQFQTNIDKAAATLVCLGLEKSSQVLSHLSLDEVEVLSSSMARVGRISEEAKKELISGLLERYQSAGFDETTGDLTFVRRLLTETFGETRAMMTMELLSQPKAARPLESLQLIDAQRILSVLSGEHPSIIAVVLYYLPRDKAAYVLSGLPDTVRLDVVIRLANLKPPVPHMVVRLEQLINKRLAETRGEQQTEDDRELSGATGARTIVEILSRTGSSIERRVYEYLQERDIRR